MKNKLLLLCTILAVGRVVVLAQTEPNLANGFIPFGSFHEGSTDSVNLMNGNLIVHIPFPQQYPQRGGRLNSEYVLMMNSKTWNVGTDVAQGVSATDYWMQGLGGPSALSSLYTSFVRTYEHDTQGSVTSYSDYDYGIITADGQQLGGTPWTSVTGDTGWQIIPANPDANGTPQGGVVIDRAGNQYPVGGWGGACQTTSNNGFNGDTVTTVCNQNSSPGHVTDTNGNVYTFLPDKDTMGRSIANYTMLPVQGVNTTSDYSRCVSSLPIYAATLQNYPAYNGSNQITVCYSAVTLQTAFNVSGINEYPNEWAAGASPPPAILPVTIILADGSKFTLTYDSYGEVTSLGLPLGGSISYQWETVSFPVLNVYQPVSRAVSQRTVTDNNGNSYVWKYQWITQESVDSNGYATNYTNIITDPLGNDSVHVFTNFGVGFFETSTLYYQGSHASGQLLKRIDTGYQAPISGLSAPNVSSLIAASYAWPVSIQTTVYPSGKVSLVTKSYDSVGYAKVVTEKEYDWGSGAPGPLLRETDTTYEWQANSAYLSAHLLDLPATVVVKDGSGCALSETDYTYDESAYLTSYQSTVGALPAGTFGPAPDPSPVRGNLSTVTRYLAPASSCNPKGGTPIATHTNWYDTGEVLQQIDALGRATTHSYDPVYAGAYSTKTCSPATNGGATAHCVSGTYDFTTGLITSFTNENATQQASGNTQGDSAHTVVYGYDLMSRLKTATFPPDPNSGGSQAVTQFNYPVPITLPFTVTKTRSITSSLTDSLTNTYDGLGRVYKTQHPLPNGTAEVDTTYDGLGHVASVTNPYFSTSDPTYGLTQTAYDALGRATQVTEQDGSARSVSYNVAPLAWNSGDCTVSTDEAGHQRKTCSDGLGRLIEVDESNPGAAATTATGWVSIGGAEQTANSQPATSGSGTVTISGSEQTACIRAIGSHCQTFRSDFGNVVITVNGHGDSYKFGGSDTPSSIASALAGTINNDGSAFVTAVASGSTITLTARTTGAATNYSFTAAAGFDSLDFSSPSFTASPASGALTGGQNASVTADSGTITVTLNGTGYTTTYGLGDTSSTIAGRLAGIISSGSYANASASGSTINLTGKSAGSADDYSLSGSYSWNTGQFTNPSFTTSTSGSSMSGGFDATALNNSPFVTTYQYDGLGDLLRVDQKGTAPSDSTQWRTRLFTYDTLGRLLTAYNPESGTINYAYDANGNLLQKVSPQANQTGSATQTISYCYDELNRLTGRAYSAQTCQGTQLPSGAAVVSYAYDQGANAKGKLTSLADQAGSASYTYDVLDRMAGEQRVISGVTKTMSYGYNLDGSLKTLTYPSGATVTYTPDSAGRDVSAIDSANGINYATSASYDAASNLTGFVSGNSGSFAGITNSFSYNKRLQPINMSASAPSQTVFSIGYDFHLGNGDNGNVFGITNYRDNSRNQSFTYDSLNRLTSAQTIAGDCSQMSANGRNKNWGNSYGYDAWGNLLSKSVTKCGGENLSVTAGPNNQLQGAYTYDAAGNMLHDATANLNYSYDQENRITGAAAYTYTYDGDGNRVKKSNGSTGTLYWYLTPGIVAESDLSGNLQSEYVFFAGERAARKDFPTGTVSYYFSDHLKTAAVITDAAGNIKEDEDYYPWGGELQFVNNDSNHYKFTGKERDSETGLDYFGARYYSNGLGRFVSADWSAIPIPVPYADSVDPQSLNLYAYVRNVPTTRLDLDGHEVAVRESDGLGSLGILSPSGCPPLSTCRSDLPPISGAFINRDRLIGAGKEAFSEILHISPTQTTIDQLNEFLGVPDPLAASNQDQAKAMKLTSILIFFIPVGGEEAAGTKLESLGTKAATAVEKAMISRLTAEAEHLYPKLAGKVHLHHVVPKYLGGVQNGLRKEIPAAYHQFITNAFRELAPYGQKFEGSLQKIIEEVYRRFPLP